MENNMIYKIECLLDRIVIELEKEGQSIHDFKVFASYGDTNTIGIINYKGIPIYRGRTIERGKLWLIHGGMIDADADNLINILFEYDIRYGNRIPLSIQKYDEEKKISKAEVDVILERVKNG